METALLLSPRLPGQGRWFYHCVPLHWLKLGRGGDLQRSGWEIFLVRLHKNLLLLLFIVARRHPSGCTAHTPLQRRGLTAKQRDFNFRHVYRAWHVPTRGHLQVSRDAGEDGRCYAREDFSGNSLESGEGGASLKATARAAG